MTTTPIATAAAATGGSPETQASNPNGMLGQNDFLKLMVAQLQAQDPLNPGNTNEFIGELAQFTEVEQTTNLASANELSSGVQMIGRTVDYTHAGLPGSGKVTSVQSTADGVTLTIEGTTGIPLSAITEVQ